MQATAQQVDTVVIVTRSTELDELLARFNTAPQARFYLERAGRSFEPIQEAHDRYQKVVSNVVRSIPQTVKGHVIDRALVPQYRFGADDVVVTIGQDGLVSNTAKYLSGQPIVAVNPDPTRYDGVLLPFDADTASKALRSVLLGKAGTQAVTLGRAQLSDGQSLLAFNDFFVGARSHVSARYALRWHGRTELHSSSGVIVSTGAGSSGWLQSVYAGAAGIVEALGGAVNPPANDGRLEWHAERLVFAVREPFPSRTTGTSLVYGLVSDQAPLVIESRMASDGVIFSDGIEADYLEFNAGATVTIGVAPEKARLVLP